MPRKRIRPWLAASRLMSLNLEMMPNLENNYQQPSKNRGDSFSCEL
jgi:hypothetical protein